MLHSKRKLWLRQLLTTVVHMPGSARTAASALNTAGVHLCGAAYCTTVLVLRLQGRTQGLQTLAATARCLHNHTLTHSRYCL
jgi:hypothetical protein